MDSKQYAPGTVAVATVRGEPETKVIRRKDGWAHDYIQGLGFTHDDYSNGVTDVRPLVVLESDLGGNWTTKGLREGARRCRDADSEFGVGNVAALLDRLADEIEQQTRPPKPAEPRGLGAVVEDAEGRRFVRTAAAVVPWLDADDTEDGYDYAELGAVKVLSEGVIS